MYPTVTVEHLASVPTADDSDDLKIYELDRGAKMDVLFPYGLCNTMPGKPFSAFEEVLAA